ncbi:hypothetical protein H8K33_05585 [Undibacterium amnicola]|uniref:Uncharacterized protein n=1 Tax=Undibacterium amnicola TaxID=1834038 RepID=A0ABR6XN82_9BURK|nr:hypothetical protein [Undibacterium amnicola]MBC3830970.1 hypothetical protein [Undibacterium amnicola]
MGAEHVTTLEKFRVRPGYKSRELLVEFCGDHRSSSYPNIANLLQDALNAKLKKHPVYDTVRIGLATDEFITLWEYSNGEFQLNDDTWGYFAFAPNNNALVIEDIERVLLQSGRFVKEGVDFADYA